MEFLRSIIIDNATPAADGTYTYDLPVNPVSHLMLVIKALNITNEATPAEILAMISNVHVLHRGTSILQLSATHLNALDRLLFGKTPIGANQVATDDATRFIALPVPFGRRLYNPDECFPESKAGELQLQLTVDIANAGADGLILQLEACELLGATPSRYLKTTTLTHTPAAAGDSDVDLPLGNLYSALMLWGTTIPTGTAWTTTIDKIKLLLDNVEHYVSSENWEALRGELILRPGHEPGWTIAAGDDDIANWAIVDFDPARDDKFLLDTAPLSSAKLRVTAGDTNPLNVFPLELVRV